MRIEATDVTKSYGTVTALDELSLSIPSGSTFGLLGTNGAGKTTLFRLLIGHETPDDGTVRIGETTVSTAGPAVRQHIGYLPERVGFPDELTAREVLTTTARIRDLPVRGRVETVLETVGLAQDADRPVEGFSNGMRRRLGLATALLPDPAVLLLDEPTAGLDPLGVAAFHRIIEEVSERTGATVVVCSHALAEIERLCDRVAILESGQLLTTGTLTDLTVGSDGRRTVRVRPADSEQRTLALEVCEEVGQPRRQEGTVTVDVQSETVLELLSRLDETVGLDRVELGGHGLDETFERVVAHEGSADDAGSCAVPADGNRPAGAVQGDTRPEPTEGST